VRPGTSASETVAEVDCSRVRRENRRLMRSARMQDHPPKIERPRQREFDGGARVFMP
jgi:hypothetical protein